MIGSEYVEAFGAEVLCDSDDAVVVSIPTSEDGRIVLSYGRLGREVRIRWIRSEFCLVDIGRESIGSIQLDPRGFITIGTEGHGLAGEITIGLYPVRFIDSLLVERDD